MYLRYFRYFGRYWVRKGGGVLSTRVGVRESDLRDRYMAFAGVFTPAREGVAGVSRAHDARTGFASRTLLATHFVLRPALQRPSA